MSRLRRLFDDLFAESEATEGEAAATDCLVPAAPTLRHAKLLHPAPQQRHLPSSPSVPVSAPSATSIESTTSISPSMVASQTLHLSHGSASVSQGVSSASSTSTSDGASSSDTDACKNMSPTSVPPALCNSIDTCRACMQLPPGCGNLRGRWHVLWGAAQKGLCSPSSRSTERTGVM